MTRIRGRQDCHRCQKGLRYESLELRCLLATQNLVGTAWQDIWRSPPNTSLTSESNDVVTADVNSDGIPDLLVHSGLGGAAYLGVGDGSFADAVDLPKLTRPWLVADLDNDGDQDLASFSGIELYVLENLGVANGVWSGFQRTTSQTLAQTSQPAFQLLAADWNGDGRTDVAIATIKGVLVSLGAEDNKLGDTIEYPLEHVQRGRLVTGDFDQDGDLDLISAIIHVRSA